MHMDETIASLAKLNAQLFKYNMQLKFTTATLN